MVPYVFFLLSAGAVALLARERRIRRNTERLGAATLESLLDTIDANSPETGAHVRRVASYALILADSMDLEKRECHDVERVALFHDIGKLDGAISDIIAESRKLTPEDRRAVRNHPRRGAEVLEPLSAFYPALGEGVMSHHERWDGTGYPRGLRGRAIPLSARIVTIADTFDAVTHARSYSSGQSAEAAFEIIERGRGKQFDPDLVDLLLTPPVRDEILKAMKAAYAPKRAHGKRRRKRHAPDIPDINFRWRSSAREPRHADR